MGDERIAYRPGWRQMPWYLLIWPAGQLLLRRDELGRGFLVTYAAILLVLLVAELSWLRTTGVDLTPDALVMRGLSRRVIPWREVEYLRMAPMLGSQGIVVKPYGRPEMRLRAPQHTPFLAPDRDFKAKADAIYLYWLAHRGEGWTPPEPRWATSAGA